MSNQKYVMVPMKPTPEWVANLRNIRIGSMESVIEDVLAAAPAEQGEPVAWMPYLSDRADGVTGHYAIARKNPAGYREVWNLRHHRWAAFSDEVLTMDEALAILKKLEMPTAPITQNKIEVEHE